MKKVTGIGGVFFKTKDPDQVKAWYKEHLGMNTDQYGCLFSFRLEDRPEVKGHLQWSTFKQDTDYFKPSEKEFMINYRVDDLVALEKELRAAGVNVLDTIEEFEYGKFLHIMDLEGNKIELWEPVDGGFG